MCSLYFVFLKKTKLYRKLHTENKRINCILSLKIFSDCQVLFILMVVFVCTIYRISCIVIHARIVRKIALTEIHPPFYHNSRKCCWFKSWLGQHFFFHIKILMSNSQYSFFFLFRAQKRNMRGFTVKILYSIVYQKRSRA